MSVQTLKEFNKKVLSVLFGEMEVITILYDSSEKHADIRVQINK